MAIPEQATQETELVDTSDSASIQKSKRSIYQVPVTVTVSLGQMRLSVSDVLDLQSDSIVPLNARLEDPVELTIDNRVIARGDLVETDEGGLAVRITEIPEEAPIDHG